MSRKFIVALLLIFSLLVSPEYVLSASPTPGPLLIYHNIVRDTNGYILPWYSPENLGDSYDHIINLVWNFWITMPNESNGVPMYLQRRMYNLDDPIGGDQIAMALSSWQLLYQYTGNPAVRTNMEYMANFYLDYGLSSSSSSWPNIPFPANQYGSPSPAPGFYSGDVMSGVGVTQPDKAGSFGVELITLYKMTNTEKYLTGAINIANTLASKTVTGDANNSPLPFKVKASTGQIEAPYTTNWTGTLRLFDQLIQLNQGNTSQYVSARDKINVWLKIYPIQNNNWGPFFEDIGGYSNTEINADTLAWYILENPSWDANWQYISRSILNNTELTFGNPTWSGINWTQYGVLPINEQSAYTVPGNSHTSRHASVELIYIEKTGDTNKKSSAIRQLNWATYMVDVDGKNKYPENEIWLTDGYGDYIRHYLRSMGAMPELAPTNQNHILKSSSVIKNVTYESSHIRYTTFDTSSTETIKTNFIPRTVTINNQSFAQRTDLTQAGWIYTEGTQTLKIRHDTGSTVDISGTATTPQTKPGDANGDGKVDGQDYITWLINYNAATILGPQKGDFNRDGKTDGLDYVVWLTNYGI